MHRIFLINDPDKFWRNMEIEESDVKLKFWLTYGEWLCILLDIFSIDEKFSDEQKVELRDGKIILCLSSVLEGYPMFSKIKDTVIDAVYCGNDILRFKDECEKLLELASEDESKKGLETLIKVCDLALANKKNIFFLGV